MTRLVVLPGGQPRLRVVVADSDVDTRSMYREALRPLTLDMIDAGDGRDALVQCLLQPPALLIADTQLATIDGYQLCQLLRRDSATRSVPILIVTSETRPAELTRLRQLGATQILSKPTPLDGFCSDVAGLCAGVVGCEPAVPATGCVRAASRTFQRFDTTAPPNRPPALRCRECDRPLDYQKSRVGGVSRSHTEQWDHFRCGGCAGVFEYRHRTRKLRSS